MTKVEKSVRAILRNCVAIGSKESVAIVIDEALPGLGEIVWKHAKRMTRKALIVKYSAQYPSKTGLPEPVLNSLLHADVLLALSSSAVSELAFEQAQRNGARILVLQNVTNKLLERSLGVKYERVANASRRLADHFSIGRTLRLESPSGTDVTVPIVKIKGIPETGFALKAGEIASLPAGEACVVVNRRHITGRIVLDRLAGERRSLQNPIILNMQKGRMTQIKGRQEAEQLRKELRKFGSAGRKISEIGVGTNDALSLGYSCREDQKVSGTAHVAIGQQKVSRVHGKITEAIKGIILKPTLTIDGRLIIEDGRIVV